MDPQTQVRKFPNPDRKSRPEDQERIGFGNERSLRRLDEELRSRACGGRFLRRRPPQSLQPGSLTQGSNQEVSVEKEGKIATQWLLELAHDQEVLGSIPDGSRFFLRKPQKIFFPILTRAILNTKFGSIWASWFLLASIIESTKPAMSRPPHNLCRLLSSHDQSPRATIKALIK